MSSSLSKQNVVLVSCASLLALTFASFVMAVEKKAPLRTAENIYRAADEGFSSFPAPAPGEFSDTQWNRGFDIANESVNISLGEIGKKFNDPGISMIKTLDPKNLWLNPDGSEHSLRFSTEGRSHFVELINIGIQGENQGPLPVEYTRQGLRFTRNSYVYWTRSWEDFKQNMLYFGKPADPKDAFYKSSNTYTYTCKTAGPNTLLTCQVQFDLDEDTTFADLDREFSGKMVGYLFFYPAKK